MSINIDGIVREAIEIKLSASRGIRKSVSTSSENDINIRMIDNLDKMNRTSVNRSYRPIPAKGIKGKASKAVKRLMRRLTFWYVEPCMMQQTEYNNANNIFSAEVNGEINAMRSKLKSIDSHDGELKSLGGRIDNTNQKIKDMQSEFETAEKVHEIHKNELIKQEQNQQLQIEKLNITISQMQEKIELLEKLSYYTAGVGGNMINEQEAKEMRLSFAQSGEDAIIRYIFSASGINPKNCRYLDLGANHAVHLSNTYSFYLDGARGVLLDANPILADELRERRKEDIVINKCISDKKDTKLKFYIMNGDGLSTSDYNSAMKCIKKNPKLKIEREIEVDSITIDEIIKEYFPDKAPEILNIDVEGMEMAILKTINFETFRPFVIVCEMIDYKDTLTVGEKNRTILDFMHSAGYEEFAFTGINSIFIDKKGQEVKEI